MLFDLFPSSLKAISTVFVLLDTWRSSGQSSARCSYSTSARSTDPLRASIGIFSTSVGGDPSEEETELSTTAPTYTAPNTTRPQASARMETSKSGFSGFSAVRLSMQLMVKWNVWFKWTMKMIILNFLHLWDKIELRTLLLNAFYPDIS